MYLIHKIENCGEFNILKNNLYYIKDNSLYLFKQIKPIILLNDYWGVSFYVKLINVFTNNSCNTFYDYNGNKISEFENMNFYYIFSKNNFIFYDRKEKSTICNSTTIINGKIGYFYLYNDNFFFEKNEVICLYNLNSNFLFWQYDLSPLPKWKKYENEILPSSVEQFLGVYEGVLWLQLNGYRLLGLDVQTGEQIHYIENSGLYINLYLNQKTGKIIELASKSYEEFDLKSLKMTKSIELEKDFNIRKCTYYEDDTKIYFVGKYKEERKNNCYGIFDVEKEQIVWHRLSEGEEEYFNPPQANEKIMGILDSNNTLTVYEKNEIGE